MAMKNRTKETIGRIGVLMGGPSSEREISLKSGSAVYESLKQLDCDVIPIDIKTDDVDENMRLIKSRKIRCAFVAMHGRFGEDGQIQGILDELEIPYTGSGKLASMLAMDKIASRKIFQIYGLAVPRYIIIERGSYNRNWSVGRKLNMPLVIKPATHGSSIGLSMVQRKEDMDRAIEIAFGFDDKVLIEEYIKGREMTVGILEGKPLAVIEVLPKSGFFDYAAKYQPGMTEYIIPAKLDELTAKKIRDTAFAAHNLLGCLGCSRVDIILSQDGTPFILEVNSIPGMTQASLLPKAANISGIDFSSLCLRLIQQALSPPPKIPGLKPGDERGFGQRGREPRPSGRWGSTKR